MTLGSMIADTTTYPNGSTIDITGLGYFREEVTINRSLTIKGGAGDGAKGSDIWTGWSATSGYYTSTLSVPSMAWTDSSNAVDFTGNPQASWCEQLFIDGNSATQIAAGSTPAAGQFCLVSSGDRHLRLGTNPSGHTIEVTTRRHVINVTAADVTITGNSDTNRMSFMHAGSDYQEGVIHAKNTGSRAHRLTLRYLDVGHGHNANIAIYYSDDWLIDHCRTHHAGMNGISNAGQFYNGAKPVPGGQQASGGRVLDCEVDHNNTENGNGGWHAAGIKLSNITGSASHPAIIQRTRFHHQNRCSSLWLDTFTPGWLIGSASTYTDGNWGYNNPDDFTVFRAEIHSGYESSMGSNHGLIGYNRSFQNGGLAIGLDAAKEYEVSHNISAWDGIQHNTAPPQNYSGMIDFHWDTPGDRGDYDVVDRTGPTNNFHNGNVVVVVDGPSHMAVTWRSDGGGEGATLGDSSNHGQNGLFGFTDAAGALKPGGPTATPAFRAFYGDYSLAGINTTQFEEGGRYFSSSSEMRTFLSDNGMPTTPTEVVVPPGSTGGTTVALTLKTGYGYVECSGDMIAGATMYELERSVSTANVWTVVEVMPYPFWFDTTETGMVPGTVYDYRYRGKTVGARFAVAATATITPRSTFPSTISSAAATIQGYITAASSGATIDIPAGVYPLNGTNLAFNKDVTLRSVNRDVIITGGRNYNDAAINASWTHTGVYWQSARTATTLTDTEGLTIVDANAAAHYNNVTGWKSGVPTRFKPIAAASTTLAADECCYVTSSDRRIRLGGTDPSTRFDRVEVAEQTDWAQTSASNVQLEGLTFWHAGSGPFGNPLGNNDQNGMQVRNCNIGFTHGVAVNFGWPTMGSTNSSGLVLEKSLIQEAGVNGMTMLNANGYRVENNTWRNCGHLYYSWRDSGGIFKIVLSQNGIVRYNVSRGTTGGGGLWWDINCVDAVGSWNKIGNCVGTPGWPEISTRIDLTDNCFYNGNTADGGPTIHVSSSYDCEIARNLIVGSGNGANSDYGRVWQVTDDDDVRNDLPTISGVTVVGNHSIHDNISERVATTNNPHMVWSHAISDNGVSWNANYWYTSNGVYNWLWDATPGSVSDIAAWNAIAAVGTDSLATADQVTAQKQWWGLTTDTSGTIGGSTSFSPIRIDCGSSASYTDSNGNTWVSDPGSTTGTTVALVRNNPISNTADVPLYLSERYGSTFTYAFSVPNNSYRVRLKFAELFWTTAGQRVFSVAINGATVLPSYDIFATAGGQNIANDQVFDVTATGGAGITITFTTTTDNAKIDGIEILSDWVPPVITNIVATAS